VRRDPRPRAPALPAHAVRFADPLRTAARLVWASLPGPEVDDEARALIGTGIGGVVLFSRNVVDPDQLAGLCRDIRAAAPGPIRISIDQEGGHVIRIAEPLTRFPSPMAIGATRDPRIAYRVARASARELARLGIDVILAPVLDLASDMRSAVVGARAYGSDPVLVARLGAAAVRGYLDGGVLPMPKHFPGHGGTPADSHLAVPWVGGTLAELWAADLAPYTASIAAGAPALMTAHVVHGSIDATVPATLSPGALVDLARSALGFDGLLVTDAIVMDAIARHHPVGRAAIDSLLAGADVVMALEAGWRTLDALESAVRNDAIPTARLNDALTRVAAFDAAADAARARIPHRVSVALHGRLARRIARASLTLVRDEGRRLPVSTTARVVLVDVGSARPSPVEDATGESAALHGAITARFPAATTVRVDPRSGSGLAEALAAAAAADVTILATRDAFASPEARLAVAAIGDANVIRVALRSPADLLLEPACGTAVAAYTDTPATADALATALAVGPSAFRGRLPVLLSTVTPEVLAA
jgi:beta-N-acetylhexosaminidase